MSLYPAWVAACKTLKPQVQGDCGVYSFWYATVLLRQIGKAGHPVTYPRACHQKWYQRGTTIRKAAKGVGSAQGELMSADEAVAVVEGFKYTASVYPNLTQTRAEFITAALNARRPVMFAYICGNDGPVTVATAVGTSGTDYGPHWSLLIDEHDDKYTYLNPHDPNTPVTKTKLRVLASNAEVDRVKYVRYWSKPKSHGLAMYGDTPPPTGKFYDIGGPERQTLNNVLIAVS